MKPNIKSCLPILILLCLVNPPQAEETLPVSVGLKNLGPIGRSGGSFVSTTGRYIVFASDAPDLVFVDLNGKADIFVLDRTTGSVTLVSTSSSGEQANQDCFEGSISADGRFLAFQSQASNLVTGDTNGIDDIFVKDLWTGTTSRVNLRPQGAQTTRFSVKPTISSGGGFVCYISSDSMLVPLDTNNATDLFIHDRSMGTTVRCNVSSSGEEANAGTYRGEPTADGRYVVFDSSATNLVPGDVNGLIDTFIRDTVSNETSIVGLGSSGEQPTLGSGTTSVSSDGRYISFQSESSDLVPGDMNGKVDVFLRDRLTNSTTRISLTSSGTESNNHSFDPDVSDDGRYVSFRSDANNLVPNDTNGLSDAYVRDTLLSTTTRVNVGPNNEQCNDVVSYPSISGDGQILSFDTIASNMVAEDVNAFDDVFYYNAPLHQVFRVSQAAVVAQGNNNSHEPSISQDGRYVAFYGIATNLVKGETPVTRDVYLRDMLSGTTRRVSSGQDNGPGSNHSYSPSLSANARYVAFESDATNLVSGDTNGRRDIFVQDVATGRMKRVSVGLAGAQANNHSYSASISSDGRFVAYRSTASNLVPGDTNLVSDIFVHDLMLGTTVRANISTTGVQAINGESDQPTISGNGRFVAFRSVAYNLVPDDWNGKGDIFRRDLVAGTTIRASVSSQGVQGNGESEWPTLSNDGRYVAFSSVSFDLVPGDNNRSDIFIRDNLAQTTLVASHAPGGSAGNGGSTEPALSGDGHYVSFRSSSSNLVADDTNNKDDVFIHDRLTGQKSLVSTTSAGALGSDHSDSPSVSADGQYIAFRSRAQLTSMPKVVGGYDIFRHERDGYRPSVSGVALLDGFIGVTWGEPLSVQVAENDVIIETLDGNSGPDGTYLFVPASSGAVTLRFRFRTSLWRAVPVILGTSTITELNIALINGDSDGDNEVSIGDYSIVSSAYGTSLGDLGWADSADLNGDETIDIADYAILSASYGQIGD